MEKKPFGIQVGDSNFEIESMICQNEFLDRMVS
jgi:hypothetical protein